MTLVELTITASILVGVVVAAGKLVDVSQGLSKTTTDLVIASDRVNRVLQPLSDAIRHGSLASMRHVDGANFSDLSTDSGFQVRTVTGYSGGAQTSELTTYRYDRPAGSIDGQVIRAEGAFETVIARGVTSFVVSRSGTLFTLTVATRSGPTDDRARTASGTIQVAARNP